MTRPVCSLSAIPHYFNTVLDSHKITFSLKIKVYSIVLTIFEGLQKLRFRFSFVNNNVESLRKEIHHTDEEIPFSFFFEELPSELKLLIASKLDVEDLRQLKRVSHNMQHVCNDEALWKVKLEKNEWTSPPKGTLAKTHYMFIRNLLVQIKNLKYAPDKSLSNYPELMQKVAQGRFLFQIISIFSPSHIPHLFENRLIKVNLHDHKVADKVITEKVITLLCEMMVLKNKNYITENILTTHLVGLELPYLSHKEIKFFKKLDKILSIFTIHLGFLSLSFHKEIINVKKNNKLKIKQQKNKIKTLKSLEYLKLIGSLRTQRIDERYNL
jgi:F-box-like